jgi:hypothetical protein
MKQGDTANVTKPFDAAREIFERLDDIEKRAAMARQASRELVHESRSLVRQSREIVMTSRRATLATEAPQDTSLAL